MSEPALFVVGCFSLWGRTKSELQRRIVGANYGLSEANKIIERGLFRAFRGCGCHRGGYVTYPKRAAKVLKARKMAWGFLIPSAYSPKP